MKTLFATTIALLLLRIPSALPINAAAQDAVLVVTPRTTKPEPEYSPVRENGN